MPGIRADADAGRGSPSATPPTAAPGDEGIFASVLHSDLRFGSLKFPGILIAVVVLTVTACTPSERINASCRWPDSIRSSLAAPSARRAHLEEDVRVAQDLGIRHGDSLAGRVWDGANRRAREACTNASFDSIMRRHAASRVEVDEAIGARVAWPDVPLVYLPVLLLFAAASHITVRQVAGAYDPDDRIVPVIILVLLTPLAAFAGVALGQIWAGFVEEVRLRSDHLSFRVAYLPLYVHRHVAFAVAAAVFALAAARYRRYLGSARRHSRG